MREKHESSVLPKLVSVPGLVAVAVLGIIVIVLARLFGPEDVLQEVVTELVASFGATILMLALFGLLFRSGLERLLQGVPGGETLAESAERFRDLLQDFDPQESNAQLTGLEAKLDRIGDDVRSVADSELP
ncbi:MAG TPA: hypothetical protein VK869_09850, partial [Rubrobacteraceae bacterium]|nr:hypothetical protein [Rubrobacteraceae bacterium]